MRFKPSRFRKNIFVIFLLCSFFVCISPAQAVPTEETFSLPSLVGRAITKLWDTSKEALKKAGSVALQNTLRSALNKVAYDTATWVGSGGTGQAPLFVTKDWGSYMTQIGDEALGQFIETFADSFAADIKADGALETQLEACKIKIDKCAENMEVANEANIKACKDAFVECEKEANAAHTKSLVENEKASLSGNKASSLNICSPSLDVKMKLALSLTEQQRPSRPNCSFSEMKSNYKDLGEHIKNAEYFPKLSNMFDVQSTDLSVALTLNTSATEQVGTKKETSKTNLIGKGGWIDPIGVGGKLIGLPDQAKVKTEQAQAGYLNNLGKVTGDALVDAGNIFLNQLAMTSFNKWMSGLQGGESTGGTALKSSSVYSYESGSSGSYGYGQNKMALMSILQPQFSERADYDVLGELAMCPDTKNPGPNNCVIDNNFMSAISDQKTIGQAVKDGGLNGSWLMTVNSKSNSYQENYSLRNAIILRKFRILPVGWESAINLAAARGKNATLLDMISCFSGDDEFRTFSSPEIESNQVWCRDLIDPNWVLKAPKSYCSKSGYGNQIISSFVASTGEDPSSEINITRQDDYCADEKTCIKENSKGSCDAYGYCTEERRTWNFSGDSCDPVYNSCESFADNSGNTLSYLKNTLDYGTCTKDNSGCGQYSTFGSYSSSTKQISWSGNSAYSIFLNSKAESCDSSSEGCKSIVRVKPSWGDNLIYNNNFNLDSVGASSTDGILNGHWKISGSAKVEMDSNINSKVLSFNGNKTGLISDSTFSVVPENVTPINGYYYTLSAEIYLESGSIEVKLGGDNDFPKVVSDIGVWQTVSLTAQPSKNISSLDFSILTAATGKFKIRNLKLEANHYFSGWSDYRQVVTQEKLIPDYLAPLCYKNPFAAGMNDYSLKDDAPEICNNYARRCNKEEVGCQNFTAPDGFSLTGQVNFDEYCPGECVNYDSYVQQKTNFQSVSADYFIPQTATSCSASAAGCSKFTNLDDIAQGGESTEYYSSLRRCVQPNGTCASFYSWGGENESGYQLVSYSLVANGNQPALVGGNDSSECNEGVFNLSVTSPDYNSDCRQFYDKDGKVSYHLYSKTISCDTSCRRVRLDEKTNSAECVSNGGVYDGATCIFQALPSQSTVCGSDQSGCREYNGNNGNNVRIVSSYDFENNDPVFTGGVAISTASTNKDGKSLLLKNSASTPVDSLVVQNAAYSLKFLAKAKSGNSYLTVYMEDAAGTKKIFFDSGKINNESLLIDDTAWKIYQISLPSLSHRIELGEKLVINSGGKDIYLDSMVLTEITDRYYLIKDSWATPDICYYDLNDEYRGAEYNLGCSVYQDPNGTAHNLRQFNSLCDSSSAGCETVIDTQNSVSPFKQVFAKGTINVNEDKMIYAIFDGSKSCSSDNIGCSRLGKGTKSGSSVFFSDVYIKNNPDNYEGGLNTLCQSVDVGCNTFFGASGGETYFRNPTDSTCQYRASQAGNNQSFAWFKTAVKRCDVNSDGLISGAEKGTPSCLSDNDCGGKSCVLDSGDYPCDVSYLKTIGNNSAGTPQPSNNVGICEVASSGCSEYIDSNSESSPNLVVNPSFADLDKNGVFGDLWNNNKQDIFLRAKKLYLARSDGDIANNLTCEPYGGPVINILGSDNVISATTTSSVNLTKNATYFTLKYDSVCHLTNNGIAATRAKFIEVREALVSYQLENQLDIKTCGSKVDFDNGCVLFNNRANNGSKGAISPLIYNAFTSPNLAGIADTCSGASCNANMVVKVTPDRVCGTWLSCTTKIKDEKTGQDYCYSLGECDKLGENGECANFISTPTDAHKFAYANDKNATGYHLMDSFHVANMMEVGNRSGDMISPINFESGSAGFNFQSKISNNLPVYGSVENKNYKIIKEPKSGINEKSFSVSYPAEGKNFIGISSEVMLGKKNVVVSKNTDYYINYLLNTDELTPGASASFRILDNNNVLIKEFTDRTNGWERVVHKINVPTDSITIMFGTKRATGVSGYVYYDDIKIEPVLKINNTGVDSKDYISKECRLYPEEDSLTCTSRNENVIKNGWEGYCLKHDPINPGVCLQWLPLDAISSASTAQKSAGYKGAYPLYYCSEANANFNLVEKRLGSFLLKKTTEPECDWINFPRNGFADGHVFTDGVDCGVGYRGFYYEYYVDGYASNVPDRCTGDYVCVPESDNMTVVVALFDESYGGPQHDIQFDQSTTLLAGFKRYFTYNYPANPNYPIATTTDPTIDSGSVDSKKIISTPQGYFDGPSFNGNEHGHVFTRYKVNNSGWYKFNGNLINKEVNTIPPVRVYDNNEKPTTEDALKYVTPFPDNDTTYKNVYTPTCNKFVQVIDENGNGMPWVERLKDESTTTPAFFPIIDQSNGFGALNYPKNTPNAFSIQGLSFTSNNLFGASMLSGVSLLNKAAIGFWTGYYNNQTETDRPLAGRPYGCYDNGTGSCGYFGYCSNNPDITCLTVKGDGSAGDCGAGTSCISYGYRAEDNNQYNANQNNTLKNIFLKSLAVFGLKDGSYKQLVEKYSYNAKNKNSLVFQVKEDCISRPNGDVSFGDKYDLDFCAVYPTINNVYLYRGNGTGPALTQVSSGKWSIGPGYYTLKFNSTVDPEQQPLRDIKIDWGDGKIDLISNQDNHPGVPHIISHNYGYSSGVTASEKTIKIKITDNWEFFKFFPPGASF